MHRDSVDIKERKYSPKKAGEVPKTKFQLSIPLLRAGSFH
jgi:hypothetical protein